MIDFFAEDISMPEINEETLSTWIEEVTQNYGYILGDISYIFCSDEYILKINVEYLDHDYYTDIITFDYTEDKIISGDLFISLDTVKSNSEQFGQKFDTELHRVIIHGILHLCGLKDKSPEDEKTMRDAEDKALNKLFN